jgi:hypothetical protein
MAKSKPKTGGKLSKKEINKVIQEKLAGVLADYRQDLGEKKFATRIKKASKLFSRGVGKSDKKNTQKSKKTTVKKVELAPEPLLEQK